MATILIFCQFFLADSLYAHGYFEPAYIEYQRLFFFYPTLKNNQNQRLHSAHALFVYDTLRGVRELHNIINDFPDLEPGINITMAKYLINSGYYYEATELLSKSNDKELLGLAYLLDDRFTNARNLFIENGAYELANEINKYMKRPKKNPEVATLLSFICPGTGEIYAGNTKIGILDFILNFGSGYLLYNALRQKKYVDAGLVFGLLLNRFYMGSIYNARKSALEKNEHDRSIWLKNIKNRYFHEPDIVIMDSEFSP